MVTRWSVIGALLLSWAALSACGDGDGGGDEAADAGADVGATSGEDAGEGDVGAEEAAATLSPSSGAMSGYFPVEITLVDPALTAEQVAEAWLGDTRLILLEATGDRTLEGLTQGHPVGEAVPLVLRDSAGAELAVVEGAMSYAPALDPRFERYVAFGASLTQGVEGGSPNFHGGLMSPAAQLARQLGAYHPLPLFVPDLFPTIEVADVGSPPDCETPNIADFLTSASGQVVPKLVSEDGSEVGFHFARVDPDLEVYNVAVGGSTIDNVVQGAGIGDFAIHFVGSMVYEPYNTIGDPTERSQLEVIEALQPTLAITTDLFGNDLIAAVVNDQLFELEEVPPVADFSADLADLIVRLNALGTWTFIATIPAPTLLPVAAAKRKAYIDAARAEAEEAGADPDAAAATAEVEADALLAELDALTAAYNQELIDQLAPHDRLHVVDLAREVARIQQEPLLIDGQEVTVLKFGGLLGIDGVHFTDTGYAMVTNAFIEVINAQMGTDVPLIDLAEVLAQDPGAPRTYAEAGFDVSLCDR